MSKKLFYLVNDEAAAHQIVNQLREMSVVDEDIHAVARKDKQLFDIPRADQRQTSDVTHARRIGVIVGGLAGLGLGLLANFFPPPGLEGIDSLTLIALTTVAGMALGLFSTFLVGVAMDNNQLDRFRPAIKQGQILLLVDVDAGRRDDVNNVIYSHSRDVIIDSGELEM